MLRGKYVVVTGGSDGIGYAIAAQFAQNGAHVCIVGRNKDKLSKAVNSLIVYGTTIVGLEADLAISSEINNLAQRILVVFPQIDVLVNNAGMGFFVPFAETREDLLDKHWNLNVKAPYLLSQSLLESLIENRGNIINISSYFSHRMLVGRDTTAYSLTKGALDSFTKALAFEIGKCGVRVNGIAPGSVQTPQFQANLEKLSIENQVAFQKMVQEIYPLGKIGTVEDVAHMAVFLASPRASWITGTVVAVDGGLTTN